jgi:site-specific recombinase XerD
VESLITTQTTKLDPVTVLVNFALTGLSARTADCYRGRIKEFFSTAKPLHAQSIIDWINDGLEHNRNQRLPGIEAANQRLAAIKKLATTAFTAGLIHQEDYFWITQIKKRKRRKIEASRWLSQSQVTKLMNDLYTLDSTPSDLRNGALIAVLLGCGLRRAEAARARVGNLSTREDRHVIADLVTKGNKIRTIGIPSWSWMFLDRWLKSLGKEARDKESLLFPRMDKECTARSKQPMNGFSIARIVKDCGALLDLDDLCPHDLRRTYAQLALKNGADILMVQQGLGHSELRTTQCYLKTLQNFALGQQAGDHINPGLHIIKGVPIPPSNQPEIQSIIERNFERNSSGSCYSVRSQ